MRLTLRTLLAYLDDRLEPADAKEIGAKIAESPVAPATIERIREVLRRRRVTAPQLSGPGSGPDPNLVAEYLDLTLPPEHVAEIERICLESDAHLAEVAATHQILTLVLGEAVEISPALRERMYAIGAETAPRVEDNGHGRERVQTAGAPEPVMSRATGGAPTSFEQGLPFSWQRPPLWKRLIPVLIPVVLIGWLYWVVRDFWGGPPRPEAGRPDVALTPVDLGASQPLPPDIVATATPGEAETTDAPEPTGAGEATGADSAAAESTVGQPSEEPVVSPTPVEGTTPAEPVPATTVAVAPEPVIETPTAPAAVPVEAEPPAAPVDLPQVLYNSVEGVLLRYEQEGDDWTVMPRRALVHPGDRVACPEPFTSQLVIGAGLANVTLNGGTAAEMLLPAGQGRFALAIERGQVGVFTPEGDADAGGPVRFGLRVHGRDYQLELQSPNTLCGIEVIPRPCQGLPEGAPVPEVDGGIFVARGAVLLTRQDGRQLLLREESGWLPWQADDAPLAPGPLLAVPQWLAPGGAPLPPVFRTFASQFEREFVLDQPVSFTIPAIVKDRRPKLSEFAVQTLSLTGNYRQLLRALQADHAESRQAAIIGLRQWLPLSPDNGPLLLAEIGRAFRDADEEAVYQLLWGYTEDAARDPQISHQLVSWLGHEEIAIRELAYKNLLDLTGRSNDYLPMAPLVQRQAAIARWQDHLQRFGALLPPAAQ